MKTEDWVTFAVLGLAIYVVLDTAFGKKTAKPSAAAPPGAPPPAGAQPPSIGPPTLQPVGVSVPNATVFDLANPVFQYQLDEIAYSP